MPYSSREKLKTEESLLIERNTNLFLKLVALWLHEILPYYLSFITLKLILKLFKYF